MGRRHPREARFLGLWTAAWLGALLLAALLWLGDLALQWPVLLIPVLWALVAARPRGDGRGRGNVQEPGDGYGHRTDTVERPALRPPRRREGDR